MTPEQITLCIELALAGAFELPGHIHNIQGFTSPCIQRLFANLVSLKLDTAYLEIGVHRGATFFAAAQGLRGSNAHALAIDNWSQFDPNGSAKEEFRNRYRKELCSGTENLYMIDKDCFSEDILIDRARFDIFFYDGDHSYASTYKALNHYLPYLSNEFLYIVDDYNWSEVRNGVHASVNRLVETFQILPLHITQLVPTKTESREDWWNGLYLGLFKKC